MRYRYIIHYAINLLRGFMTCFRKKFLNQNKSVANPTMPVVQAPFVQRWRWQKNHSSLSRRVSTKRAWECFYWVNAALTHARTLNENRLVRVASDKMGMFCDMAMSIENTQSSEIEEIIMRERVFDDYYGMVYVERDDLIQICNRALLYKSKTT